MTYEKWIGKASKMGDELLNNGAKYDENESGAFIASERGDWGLWIDGGHVFSGDNNNSVAGLAKNLFELVKDAKRTTATAGRTGDGKKAVRLAFGDDPDFWPCVYPKLIKKFPGNAVFYASGRHKPVLVCMEDKSVSHPIGIVMPIRYWTFEPDANC